MMNVMANTKKAKKLNKNLKMLGGQELNHLEKQVKSLLDIQNSTQNAKPRPLCRYKKPQNGPT